MKPCRPFYPCTRVNLLSTYSAIHPRRYSKAQITLTSRERHGVSNLYSTACSGWQPGNIKPSQNWPLWGDSPVICNVFFLYDHVYKLVSSGVQYQHWHAAEQKIPYELLNLRTLKISSCTKYTFFSPRGRYIDMRVCVLLLFVYNYQSRMLVVFVLNLNTCASFVRLIIFVTET